eukprot:14996013-Alexandrium_andersonii.AAC.1
MLHLLSLSGGALHEPELAHQLPAELRALLMGTRPFPGEDGENQLVARRHGVDRGDASPETRSKGEQHDQIPSAGAEE